MTHKASGENNARATPVLLRKRIPDPDRGRHSKMLLEATWNGKGKLVARCPSRHMPTTTGGTKRRIARNPTLGAGRARMKEKVALTKKTTDRDQLGTVTALTCAGKARRECTQATQDSSC